MSTDRNHYVTRSQLVENLSELGLKSGDLVMLHASVKAVGWIVGGPQILLDAILDVLGERGTLTMMVGWEDYPYHLAKWPKAKQEAYISECPAFDPKRSRANHREFGILCEYLRTLPGTLRSSHPSSSFAAHGPRANEIVKQHSFQYGFGTESPLGFLHQEKAKILHIGAPLNTLTMLHFAEHICSVPQKKVARYTLPVLVHKKREWVELEEYDSSEGIYNWKGEDYFSLIGQEFTCSRAPQSGRVGNAKSFLIRSQELVEFGAHWMEKHFK